LKPGTKGRESATWGSETTDGLDLREDNCCGCLQPENIKATDLETLTCCITVMSDNYACVIHDQTSTSWPQIRHNTIKSHHLLRIINYTNRA
jgi:hypothetical protein